ncbi:MAG: hypothetical protein IC227_02590 [Enterococcus lacertideformus]|uniref:Uncharacterized protein n=1 Tax=Enterococcus lacertideformus TaxID=2771493 RepID=A0A931AXN7_9ENTE|nr:hypothetical protein [Enterococcus lacertideformus]
MEMKLEYENGQYIEFDIHDRNFFMGAFPEKRWKIFRSFKRFKTGKSLSELEENIYGEDGINIFIDGEPVKASDFSIYIIENSESILNECSYTKGSLMYEKMQTYKTDVEVNRFIEEITDKLLINYFKLSYGCKKILPIFLTIFYLTFFQ